MTRKAEGRQGNEFSPMNFGRRNLLLPLLLVTGLSLLLAHGGAPPAPLPPARTNALTAPRPAGLVTNAPAARPKQAALPLTNRPAGTNAPAAPGPSLQERAAKVLDAVRQFPSSAAFYPTIVGLIIVLLVVLLIRRAKVRPAAGGTAAPSSPVRTRTAGKVHACTVLDVEPEARHVWQFEARGDRFVLGRHQTTRAGEPLPSGLAAKSWTSLWQRKLNIAWLAPDQVFLRVIQLPQSDFEETLSMVEFQLEKLSPMPVTQIVWTIQILPQVQDKQQTVVVLIVARSVVEEFLGRLEGQGYLADRLDLPVLDQLLATPIQADGAWIYPLGGGTQSPALVAWWYGGVLRNLDLIALPAEHRAEGLKEQLLQMAWAGEMEGWLTSPPRWHLVAEPAAAAEWEGPLRAGLDQPLECVAPVAKPQLAGLTARRAANTQNQGNLLPAEFAVRYQQQFVDRLWMRALMAVGACYVVGVAIYFVALGVASYQTTRVENQLAALGPTYTNALQLKARYQVLKDRQELKYAALDCWNVTAQLMPTSIMLESLNFSDGKRLTLRGTAPSDQVAQLIEFEPAMRKAVVNGQPFFHPTKGENLNYQANPAAGTVTWNFSLELKRVELP
mgnify:FL=1